MAIFRNNPELCENVSEQLVAHIVGLIEQKQRNAVFLELLQVIVSSCEKGLELCQIKVVEEVRKWSKSKLMKNNDLLIPSDRTGRKGVGRGASVLCG